MLEAHFVVVDVLLCEGPQQGKWRAVEQNLAVAGHAEQAVDKLLRCVVAVGGGQLGGRDEDRLVFSYLGIGQRQRPAGGIWHRKRWESAPRASAGSRALVLDGEGVDLQRGVIGLVNSAIALGGQQTLIAVFDGELEVRVVAGTIQRNKLDLAVNQVLLGKRIPHRQRQTRSAKSQVAA